MTLAHWILEYPDTYKVPADFLILDTGIFEGRLVELCDLSAAIRLSGANEVVLPDVLSDSKKTLQQSWEALHTFQEAGIKRVMFVPQGVTLKDWVCCLEAWVARWEEQSLNETFGLTIGITSLRSTPGMQRHTAIIKALQYDYQVHLLGVASIDTLTRIIDLPVRGLDTSLAFALGAEGVLLTPDAPKIHLKPPECYLGFHPRNRRLIRLNTLILQYWFEIQQVNKYIPIEVVRIAAGPNASREVFSDPNIALTKAGCRGEWAMWTKDERPVAVFPLNPVDCTPRVVSQKEV